MTPICRRDQQWSLTLIGHLPNHCNRPYFVTLKSQLEPMICAKDHLWSDSVIGFNDQTWLGTVTGTVDKSWFPNMST